MEKIERALKILKDETTSGYLSDWQGASESLGKEATDDYLRIIASQICHIERKPDEGRLLTDEEIKDITMRWTGNGVRVSRSFVALAGERAVAKAQDAKTASIKDEECKYKIDEATFNQRFELEVECQAKIGALIEEYDGIFNEIVIPMFLRFEEKYGFDNQARLNVEAGVQALKATHLKGEEG